MKHARANMHNVAATPRTIPVIAPADTVLEADVATCAEFPLTATVCAVPLLNVTRTGAREAGLDVEAELAVLLCVPDTVILEREEDVRVFADGEEVVVGDATELELVR